MQAICVPLFVRRIAMCDLHVVISQIAHDIISRKEKKNGKRKKKMYRQDPYFRI